MYSLYKYFCPINHNNCRFFSLNIWWWYLFVCLVFLKRSYCTVMVGPLTSLWVFKLLLTIKFYMLEKFWYMFILFFEIFPPRTIRHIIISDTFIYLSLKKYVHKVENFIFRFGFYIMLNIKYNDTLCVKISLSEGVICLASLLWMLSSLLELSQRAVKYTWNIYVSRIKGYLVYG